MIQYKGLTKDQKLSMSYAVKADQKNSTKEISMSERTVNIIGNTYNYFDSDYDILMPGSCAKSIIDRGPTSKMPGKIKHLSNHDLNKGIGRIDLLEETQVDGNDVLRAYSYMSETDDGEETLIKYNEGLIDQHSIGFQYLQIDWIEEDTNEWDKMLAMLINPDDAIKIGFGFIVKEIKLYEISSLDGFGANRLTPYLGSKSENKNVQFNNLISKLDALHTALKTGSVKDKYTVELQEQQIKQMIYELYHPEPSIKDTLPKPSKKNTFDVEGYLKNVKIIN